MNILEFINKILINLTSGSTADNTTILPHSISFRFLQELQEICRFCIYMILTVLLKRLQYTDIAAKWRETVTCNYD